MQQQNVIRSDQFDPALDAMFRDVAARRHWFTGMAPVGAMIPTQVQATDAVSLCFQRLPRIRDLLDLLQDLQWLWPYHVRTIFTFSTAAALGVQLPNDFPPYVAAEFFAFSTRNQSKDPGWDAVVLDWAHRGADRWWAELSQVSLECYNLYRGGDARAFNTAIQRLSPQANRRAAHAANWLDALLPYNHVFLDATREEIQRNARPVYVTEVRFYTMTAPAQPARLQWEFITPVLLNGDLVRFFDPERPLHVGAPAREFPDDWSDTRLTYVSNIYQMLHVAALYSLMWAHTKVEVTGQSRHGGAGSGTSSGPGHLGPIEIYLPALVRPRKPRQARAWTVRRIRRHQRKAVAAKHGKKIIFRNGTQVGSGLVQGGPAPSTTRIIRTKNVQRGRIVTPRPPFSDQI